VAVAPANLFRVEFRDQLNQKLLRSGLGGDRAWASAHFEFTQGSI
jgi:hypothetical protein